MTKFKVEFLPKAKRDLDLCRMGSVVLGEKGGSEMVARLLFNL